MKITTEEVKKIALLSRLSFSEDELENLKDSIKQYDTEGVAPMAHAVEQFNVMREDIPDTSFTHEEALMNAPEQEDGYFKVKRII